MEQDKKQSTEITPKTPDIISFFEKDGGFVFTYKKTEKLASAVYMVTNLFSDNEPMKWTLRKKVSDLVSFMLTYKDIGQLGLSDFVHTTKTKVLEIVSLLEVSMLGGLVSSMNFNILKNEFSNLLFTLDSETTSPRGSSKESISSNFFHVPDSTISREYSAQNTVSNNASNNLYRTQVSPLKDTFLPTPMHKDEFKRSNRQNIILGLIKKKKEVTIKDIAMVIKDCGEKTIQRELISFIEAGVLKRVGERRWSKYMLA
jgi:hypothetical protein